MNKLLITGVSALALIATPAFADDSRSQIDQIAVGSGANVANVNQTGGNSSDSFIDQLGNRNNASVTQTGFGNASAIDQRDFSGNGGPAPAQDNRATVNQSGGTSFSDIQQDGQRNQAEVTMSGVGEDQSSARQTDAAGYRNGENRESLIQQVGSDNFARLTQRSSRSSSTIKQGYDDVGTVDNSNSNNAQVTQDSSGFSESSTVIQGGSNNSAFVYQNGTGNNSEIDQQGTFNFADVAQFSNRNISNVNQTGDGHSATVRQ